MYALILYIALYNGDIVKVDLSKKYSQKFTSRTMCEIRRLKVSDSHIRDIIHKTPYNFNTTLTIGTDYDSYVTKCKDLSE